MGKIRRTFAVLALLLLSSCALGVTSLSSDTGTSEVHGHWSPTD